MKVDGGNGRWYTRDHPHEIISPHVMRFEEIREWLTVLSTDKRYGWAPGGTAGLCRALGMKSNRSIERKLTTGWIWPKEQVRLTARIREILDGKIVPRRFGTRVEGVFFDPPCPPDVPIPKVVKIQVQIGKLNFLPPERRHQPLKLPCFKDAFTKVPTWNPK